MNIKDFVENLQILNIVASRGDLDIQRLVSWTTSIDFLQIMVWGSKFGNNVVTFKQKYVADFYISDFQSGLRALVKAGYGAKVAPFVKPATVVEVTKENKDLSPSFLRWLADRSLSSDDRIMRLKEGYATNCSVLSPLVCIASQCYIFRMVDE
jgi:hypothetical protein